MTQTAQPRGVHLVGSVPLRDAHEVFTTISARIGDRVKRIPDGETGPRSQWIGWQFEVLADHPALEVIPAPADARTDQPRLGVRAGTDVAALEFGPLGYASAASDGYHTFEALQAEGVIASRVRFQVSLPTPLAVARSWFPHDFIAIEPRYEAAMHHEVTRILDAIPAAKLAIQLDVCAEVLAWEGVLPVPFEPVHHGLIERIVRVAGWFPDDVELGIHLCYGDYKHQHSKEPADTDVAVQIANAILDSAPRAIQWVHLPIPIERDDDEYFAPLSRLELHPDTDLFLGLVHMRDGIDGAQRRIAAAKKVVSTFGVATECGMGRRPPDRGGRRDTLIELLDIHAAVSARVAGTR